MLFKIFDYYFLRLRSQRKTIKRLQVGKIVLLFLTLTISIIVNGQQVSGYVNYGDDRTPLVSANITLNSLPDSLILAFTHTNELGYFTLSIKAGEMSKYYLKVSHVNAHDKYLPISFEVQGTVDLKIEMTPRTFVLEEIEVVALRPAVSKGDTTSYNVLAFQNGGERSLEDVLKKMPNIRVETNGDIYFKNKKVEKILLDGDDLFEGGYQLATRSINPNVLDKVQAFENYNDSKLLQQIEQSDKTVLNLKVKEEKKSLLFGNIDVGVGPKRHDGAGSLFSYQKKVKIYSILSANNVGLNRLDPVSTQGMKINRKFSSVDQKLQGFTPMRNDPFIRVLNSPLENINNERIAALNFVYNPKKKFKVTTNVVMSSDIKNQLRVESFKSLTDPSIFYYQYDTLKQQPNLLQGRLECAYDLSDNSNVIFRSTFASNEIPLSQNTLLVTLNDTTLVPQYFNNGTREWQHSIDFIRKLTKRSAFVSSLSINGFQIREKLDLELNQSLKDEIFPTPQSSGSTLSQTAIQHNRYLSGQIGWLYGTTRKKFEFYLGYSDSDFTGDISQSDPTPHEDLSFTMRRGIFFTRSDATLSWKGLSASGNVQVNATNNRLNELKQDKTLFQTGLTLNYTLNKFNQISLAYSKSMNPVSNTYLINQFVVNSYRTAQNGNFNFMFDGQDQISFSYLFTDLQRTNLNLIASIFTVRLNDFWNLADYTQTSEYTLTRVINTTSTRMSGINITAEKLIYPLSGNVKLDFKVSHNELSQVVNSIQQKSKLWQYSTVIKYVSAFDFPINTEVGTNYNSSHLAVVSNSDHVLSLYSTINHYVKVIYSTPQMNINMIAENYRIQQNSTFLLKAKMHYKVNEKLTLGLEGYNLLDQKVFNQISASPTLYTQSYIGLLNRMILINGSIVL